MWNQWTKSLSRRSIKRTLLKDTKRDQDFKYTLNYDVPVIRDKCEKMYRNDMSKMTNLRTEALAGLRFNKISFDNARWKKETLTFMWNVNSINTRPGAKEIKEMTRHKVWNQCTKALSCRSIKRTLLKDKKISQDFKYTLNYDVPVIRD